MPSRRFCDVFNASSICPRYPASVFDVTFVGRVRLVSYFTTLRDDHCTGCVPPKKINIFYPWNKDKKYHVQ